MPRLASCPALYDPSSPGVRTNDMLFATTRPGRTRITSIKSVNTRASKKLHNVEEPIILKYNLQLTLLLGYWAIGLYHLQNSPPDCETYYLPSPLGVETRDGCASSRMRKNWTTPASPFRQRQFRQKLQLVDTGRDSLHEGRHCQHRTKGRPKNIILCGIISCYYQLQ